MDKLDCDKQQSLLKKTLELVENDDRSLLQLYSDTGLPFYWLRQLVAGAVKNPSVNRIQYLYEKLSGNELI
jgi:hypothetical protein